MTQPAAPKNLRATRQRAAIAKALDAVDGFRTAQELHGTLRAGGVSVGLTTVYRTLQSLAEAGEVDVLRTTGGEAIYRRCGIDTHHHHLVCRSCGLSVEIESDEIENWAARTAKRHGFKDTTHTAELYGTCRGCSNQR